MNRDVPKILIIIALIVGILFFALPTAHKIINNYNHRNYLKTTASFIGMNGGCPQSKNGTELYTHEYQYIVNGQIYYYMTDYCVGGEPLKSKQTIELKYNPKNPEYVYHDGFDVFNIFQIIGGFFIIVSLVIWFIYWTWLRHLLIIIGTLSLIINLILNHLYTGAGIIIITILSLICLISIMRFALYLKNNKFEPIADIKREVETSKQLKLIKKEQKNNLTSEEIQIIMNKKAKIKKALLLFSLLPINLIISINGWYPNDTIYLIVSVISGLCFVAGFILIGTVLVGGFGSTNSTIIIAGKVIDNKDIKNIKK